MEAIDMMREFRRPIDTIVHVGANNGLESQSYLSSGATDVMYVEPIPAVYNELCSKIGLMPGHIAVNALCADESGKSVLFNIANNNGESSSIFELGNHSILHPEVEYTDRIEMQTTTMDSIRDQHPAFGYISLLVLDVQGAEVLVFRGAIETLKRTSAVYCEVSDIRVYDGGCTWREIVDVLEVYGLKLKCFRLGAHHYGNAFFVKEDGFGEIATIETGTNLALHKVAKQSSLSAWSKPGEAVKAVNGRKNGRYAFHTENENRPWWQVDLGVVTPIDHIVIYNRLDAGARRAYALQVLVGDNLSNMTVIHSQGGRPFGGLGGQPLVVGADGKAARYVRIQLPGEGILHLDEVEVYGPTST